MATEEPELLFFCGTGLAARAESAGAGEPERPAAEAVESTLPRRPVVGRSG